MEFDVLVSMVQSLGVGFIVLRGGLESDVFGYRITAETQSGCYWHTNY